MTTARHHALAARLVLAELTYDDDAHSRVSIDTNGERALPAAQPNWVAIRQNPPIGKAAKMSRADARRPTISRVRPSVPAWPSMGSIASS